jgi:hypothetical protein
MPTPAGAKRMQRRPCCASAVDAAQLSMTCCQQAQPLPAARVHRLDVKWNFPAHRRHTRCTPGSDLCTGAQQAGPAEFCSPPSGACSPRPAWWARRTGPRQWLPMVEAGEADQTEVHRKFRFRMQPGAWNQCAPPFRPWLTPKRGRRRAQALKHAACHSQEYVQPAPFTAQCSAARQVTSLRSSMLCCVAAAAAELCYAYAALAARGTFSEWPCSHSCPAD